MLSESESSAVCKALCTPKYVSEGFLKQMENKALGCRTSFLCLLVKPPSCALRNTSSLPQDPARSAGDAPQDDSLRRIAAGFGSRPEREVAFSP